MVFREGTESSRTTFSDVFNAVQELGSESPFSDRTRDAVIDLAREYLNLPHDENPADVESLAARVRDDLIAHARGRKGLKAGDYIQLLDTLREAPSSGVENSELFAKMLDSPESFDNAGVSPVLWDLVDANAASRNDERRGSQAAPTGRNPFDPDQSQQQSSTVRAALKSGVPSKALAHWFAHEYVEIAHAYGPYHRSHALSPILLVLHRAAYPDDFWTGSDDSGSAGISDEDLSEIFREAAECTAALSGNDPEQKQQLLYSILQWTTGEKKNMSVSRPRESAIHKTFLQEYNRLPRAKNDEDSYPGLHAALQHAAKNPEDLVALKCDRHGALAAAVKIPADDGPLTEFDLTRTETLRKGSVKVAGDSDSTGDPFGVMGELTALLAKRPEEGAVDSEGLVVPDEHSKDVGFVINDPGTLRVCLRQREHDSSWGTQHSMSLKIPPEETSQEARAAMAATLTSGESKLPIDYAGNTFFYGIRTGPETAALIHENAPPPTTKTLPTRRVTDAVRGATSALRERFSRGLR